jgi:anthranilate/para-aminobenzoate synthase component I
MKDEDRAEAAAAWANREGVDGLVWLDRGSTDGESLVAAMPERVFAGEASAWAELEDAISAFQDRRPGGCVAGWVEYSGAFCFGLYPMPAIWRHASQTWRFPGGVPDWFSACEWDAKSPLWWGPLPLSPEMKAGQFIARVKAAQEQIAAGNIYQVNLAHRFTAAWPAGADPFALYGALRARSPAPQAAYMALGGSRIVLSSSPEEFLRFDGRRIRTRPIKGTRARGWTPAEDSEAARSLLASPKEHAELLMITDLMRNDLGRICEFGSVATPELRRLEQFAQVQHLVATVEGCLLSGMSHAAALRACLPGGSITGAPKQRAMAIIESLEPVPRGLYTGTIGCFGWGDPSQSRFNIAIRTLIIENGAAHFHVGAGIVADSDPAQEWQETLDKAAGILIAAALVYPP